MSERNFAELFEDMIKATQTDEGVQITEKEANLLIKKLLESANILQEKNHRYKQALEFYAGENNYELTGEKTYIGHGDFIEETWIEVDVDKGKRARQALAGESK